MRLGALASSLLGLILLGSSPPAGAQRRVAAEWEPHESTWMQWPKGQENSYKPNFANIIDALQEYEPIHVIVQSASARSQAQNYLANRGVAATNLHWHIVPYDWAWMRDNGPVWVDVAGLLTAQDWVFDGWGGEVVNTWAKDDAVPCQVADIVEAPCEAYSPINERGTLEFNGVDTLIASWPVLSDRNPGWTQAQMETLFEQAFGVTEVVWLLSEPASDVYTGGHVDGIARFIAADTVVVSRYVDQGDPEAAAYEDAAQILEGAGLNVLRLDIPGYITYFNVPMAANYINWYVANDVVIVSGFGNAAWDAAAKLAIEGFFPGRAVHVVDTREIWYWGGGAHCVTNDRPAASAASAPVPALGGWGMLGTIGLLVGTGSAALARRG